MKYEHNKDENWKDFSLFTESLYVSLNTNNWMLIYRKEKLNFQRRNKYFKNIFKKKNWSNNHNQRKQLVLLLKTQLMKAATDYGSYLELQRERERESKNRLV